MKNFMRRRKKKTMSCFKTEKRRTKETLSD